MAWPPCPQGHCSPRGRLRRQARTPALAALAALAPCTSCHRPAFFPSHVSSPQYEFWPDQRGRGSHLNNCQGKAAARRAEQGAWALRPASAWSQSRSGGSCSQESEAQVLDSRCASHAVSRAFPPCQASLGPFKSLRAFSQSAGGETEAQKSQGDPLTLHPPGGPHCPWRQH